MASAPEGLPEESLKSPATPRVRYSTTSSRTKKAKKQWEALPLWQQNVMASTICTADRACKDESRWITHVI